MTTPATINLRKSKTNTEKQLHELWINRVQLCANRKQNEIDVENENKKIASILISLLQPICIKTNTSIIVDISESQTLLHVLLDYSTRTEVFSPAISLSYPPVYRILFDEQSIKTNIRNIEKHLRFMKKALGIKFIETSKKNTLGTKMFRDTKPRIIFNTKTRYF